MAEVLELKSDIWTYQDYLELPSDGKVYQIIEGGLYMVPAPTTYHQKVSINLASIIWNYVKKINWGEIYDAPIDVILSTTDIVQPDIIGISKERLSIVKEKGIFGTPDLVIEILSPSTWPLDLKLKKGLYERYGIQEYWLVYPEEKKVQCFLMKGGKYHLLGTYFKNEEVEVATIAGLRIDLKEVF